MHAFSEARLIKLALAFSAALALSACGIRGALEPPPEPERTTDTSASADSGQGKPEDAAPKPHKESILDGLIR
jgi:predicted small lipoprotein YifL